MGGSILKFELEGRMACFRKYYSNKNVLSYYIPPRTAIAGLLASILKLDQDSYYDLFSTENINISVKVNDPLKVYVTPMNHLSSKGGRRQVRHQFLMPYKNKISYNVYLFFKSFAFEEELVKRIRNKNFGYGISLGQKQFKGYISNEEIFNEYEILDNYSGEISTIVSKENVIEIHPTRENTLVKELMPINFKRVKKGREPLKYGDILYDKEGQLINGTYRRVMKVNEEFICFFDMGDKNE